MFRDSIVHFESAIISSDCKAVSVTIYNTEQHRENPKITCQDTGFPAGERFLAGNLRLGSLSLNFTFGSQSQFRFKNETYSPYFHESNDNSIRFSTRDTLHM